MGLNQTRLGLIVVPGTYCENRDNDDNGYNDALIEYVYNKVMPKKAKYQIVYPNRQTNQKEIV